MAKQFFSFEVEGLNQVLKGLDKLEDNVLSEADGELKASAAKISRDAKSAAPIDLGFLRNAISVVENGRLDYEVVAQRHYAPYVEFGTGGLVDVPAGLEDYAIQFKGKGIKQVNLPARPYLFPSYEQEKVKLLERLRKTLAQKASKGITVIQPGSGSNITSITTI